ncbi:methyltransferase domain-containing protein [Hamadaea sp. NPDC051192]|uniref:methyltransferase domain-containing protein n=1 Tax=Hamadaea sp. NPDC051192 TaxID=3154940 RepID=UPI0034123677
MRVLAGRGVLGPGWGAAFAQTPRHAFVPFYLDGDTITVAHTESGLGQVYSDRPLITELGLLDRAGSLAGSGQPSVTAQMLDWLAVDAGDRVLQIGIGTGYETALLCHRVGDTQVTGVDADEQVMLTAKVRLAGVGHRPHLSAADLTDGAAGGGSFGRILSMVAVPSLPPAWVTQLARGGRVVAEIRGPLASAVLVADKTTPSAVRGRFRDLSPHYPPAAPMPAVQPQLQPASWFQPAQARYASTVEVPADAFDDRDFRFLLQLSIPGLSPIADQAPDGTPGVFLHAADGSWLLYKPTGPCGGEIADGGPQPLWEIIDNLWQRWHAWHLPGIARLGMTCHDDGRSYLWLDQESTTVTTLPPPP